LFRSLLLLLLFVTLRYVATFTVANVVYVVPVTVILPRSLLRLHVTLRCCVPFYFVDCCWRFVYTICYVVTFTLLLFTLTLGALILFRYVYVCVLVVGCCCYRCRYRYDLRWVFPLLFVGCLLRCFHVRLRCGVDLPHYVFVVYLPL